MKKILSILLSALLAVSLCSCGLVKGALKKLNDMLAELKADTTFETETFETEIPDEDFSPRLPENGMPYYDTVMRYAWMTLDNAGKKMYYDVLEAALGFEPSVTLADGVDASYVWECVFFDTPELFYLDENADINGQTITFRYAFDKDKAADFAAGLDSAFVRFFSNEITDSMSTYEKVLCLYEYIINRTRYLDSADEDYEKDIYNEEVYRAISAVGPLIDCYSICIGYARATQYLAIRLGIQTFTVKGRGCEGPHYYDLFRFDDEYYYVDTTWGDPVRSDRSIDYLTYYYFGMNTEELLRSHEIRTRVPLPMCTGTKYNYFIYNGMTADSAAQIAKEAFDNYVLGIPETLRKVGFSKIDDIYDGIWDAMNSEATSRGLYDIHYGVIKSTASGVIGIVFK